MTDREFRENTIDRLARVETQGQANNNRLVNVEKQCQLNTAEIQVVKADVQEVKADVQGVITDVQGVKTDVQGVKADVQKVLAILEEREKREAQEREERHQQENRRLTKTAIIASVLTAVLYTIVRLFI